MMSQWVPLYFLTIEDVRMLYRTFAEAFPHVMVFYYNFDTFLVGSARPFVLSPSGFQERLVSKRLAKDLAAIGLAESKDLLNAYLMGRDAMLRFAGEAPIVTDDRPIVEFTAPKAVDLATTASNYLAVTEHAESVVPFVRGVVSDELSSALTEHFESQTAQWKSARDKAAARALKR